MKHAIIILVFITALTPAHAQTLIPEIDGPWWQVAGDPDLGKYTSDKQQPVDFAVWQAADNTWQLWSCIRGTQCGGKTRLFHRWQGKSLTDTAWRPMGIAMEADTAFGETLGCLQAPYVIKENNQYIMFYGDCENICKASGTDGKTFARQLQANNKAAMFTEGLGSNSRDVMVIKVGNTYYAYYSASGKKGNADFVRTSKDLNKWSASTLVAFGGAAGTGPWSAECPFVYFHKPTGYYYLFRTQIYGANAKTSVYRSKDPMKFGVDDDQYLVTTLPVAAPEIIEHQGQLYMAALLPSLKGIQIARLKFVPKN
jgi:hypothetical protein